MLGGVEFALSLYVVGGIKLPEGIEVCSSISSGLSVVSASLRV